MTTTWLRPPEANRPASKRSSGSVRPQGDSQSSLFVGLTSLVNSLLALGYVALGGTTRLPGILIVSVADMVAPLTAAVLLPRVVYREPVRGPLRISFKLNRWFLVAWRLRGIPESGSLP